MKKFIVLFFSLAFALSASNSFAEVHFKNVSFQEALKLAAKQNKIVMVDYYTSWCGWCKRLDRDVYSQDNVGGFADSNIISIKLDAENGEGVELARSARIQGYPTVIFYNANGKEIHRQVGYQKPLDFLATLSTAVSKNK
ncbi:MAG TPA: thioredoxin family protein [Candidatus Kapabacteria bacterium]|nr:thioredoxin family protein [Candidatus Kapabacteria bacterium]